MSAKAKAENPVEQIDWPAPVLRVHLHWDGQVWSVDDAIRVASMTLPRSDATDPTSTTGFWVGARDVDGRLRYRLRLTHPLLGMEQFDDTGSVTRLTHAAHEIDIEVVVPDREPVAELEIVSKPGVGPAGIEPYTVRLAIDRHRVRVVGSDVPPARGDDHGHDGDA